MIRHRSQKQLSLIDFEWPFQVALDDQNRWVKLSQCIPWDELAEGYYRSFSADQGRPAKDARLVIGAVIIKHKLCLSDEETVQQIQENAFRSRANSDRARMGIGSITSGRSGQTRPVPGSTASSW